MTSCGDGREPSGNSDSCNPGAEEAPDASGGNAPSDMSLNDMGAQVSEVLS